MTGTIEKISGALIVAKGLEGVFLNETLEVGNESIPGEVIRIQEDHCFVQAFEETAGLRVGDPVRRRKQLLCAQLGPGLLGSIFDGILRPLDKLAGQQGHFLRRGAFLDPLDCSKRWHFRPSVTAGQEVGPGDVLGTVAEKAHIQHRIMVPCGARKSVVESIREGDFTVEEPVAYMEDGTPVIMRASWPVKLPFPHGGKLDATDLFITGQRVLDFLFPLAAGGSAMIPGGFGTGKTVLEQSIAKFSLADIVVYVGCGERGNEMTDLLCEFADLPDPRTGGRLLDRTVLIANTSNMPVAAREASIFCGCTIAEYYRQMGYHVALMADSTSRWAEALREISGRLEELPGEEGFPTYLSSRIAQFYERSGMVRCLGSGGRTGSLTIIGAVSPSGGDFSEPVTQETLKAAGVFWGLEPSLAQRRHFPSINWQSSYSQYLGALQPWLNEKLGPSWEEHRLWAVAILQRDGELQEIVQLVGFDALQENEKLVLETAALIKENFLQQSAMDERDAYCPPEKQLLMIRMLRCFHDKAGEKIASGMNFREVLAMHERQDCMRLGTRTPEEIISMLPETGET
ncbi:MAG: V-type ATP synthase subunit A [Candidatus Wallbacteria bacterium]|nr:V-type ATP synthase subunit A [Candidatus Wallbacteria bacterium]